MKSIKLKGAVYHMRLDKMITVAVHTSGIVNGVLSLANQNQARELKKISNSANMGEILHIPDEIQPHKKRHSKHKNGRNAHQHLKPLDEIQADDPRHPYSAHRPKKIHVNFSQYRKDKTEHARINRQFMEKEAEFKKLVNKIVTEKIIELKPSKLLLTQSRKLCREVRVDRDGLKTLVYKGTQEMRSLQKSLKKNEIKNIREAKKYYNKYAKELYKLTHEKKKANHLLENCRKITSSLKNNINKQIPSSVEPLNTTVINMPKATINTPTTARPTLSSQESKEIHLRRTSTTAINTPKATINTPFTGITLLF